MRSKLTVLMVTAFVDMLGLIIVYPLLPFYAERLGANAAMVGALVAAFSVAQLVSAPAWGWLSDRYGRRPAIITGLFISAVAYVIFAFAGSLWLLFLSRIIQGLGGGTIGVVQAYVADISEQKDRAKALGWLSAVTSLGAVIGPAIGSLLVKYGGRTAPGLGSAVLCVMVSMFAWRFLRESRTDTQQFEAMHAKPSIGGNALRDVIMHPNLPASRLIWIYAIAIGAFYGTTPMLPLILADRVGANEQNVGYFVMYLGAIGVIVRTGVLGRMIGWLGETRLARLGLVLLAAGLAMVAMITSYPTMAISLTLMPMGTAFVFPCITAMLSRVVPTKQRGLYMGVQHTFGGVSRVAFPLIAGFGMDTLGKGIPFVFAGAMVLAALALTMSLDRVTEPPVAATT
ncbi:MAG TPA: MFS transporter [Gemmatimonadaceae bacterium]|nr:MFS transporter [Gemmatimonadaceae bacterium]